jgi:hypothetical protein
MQGHGATAGFLAVKRTPHIRYNEERAEANQSVPPVGPHSRGRIMAYRWAPIAEQGEGEADSRGPHVGAV